MQSLARLVAHLSQTYRISPQNVVGHKDTKATDCPGRFVNMAAIRNAAGATADAGSDVDATAAVDSTPAPTQTAAVELLTDVAH
jgi:N-acetyl-anhydromuramyl-L-alanine amidase AmpD